MTYDEATAQADKLNRIAMERCTRLVRLIRRGWQADKLNRIAMERGYTYEAKVCLSYTEFDPADRLELVAMGTDMPTWEVELVDLPLDELELATVDGETVAVRKGFKGV